MSDTLNPIVAQLIAEAAAGARASEAAAADAEAVNVIDAWLGDESKHSLEEIANTMARLTKEHYAERRRNAARRLNVSVRDLDDAVATRRPATNEGSQEVVLDAPEVEPWDDAVNGSELLNEIDVMFRRFVIFQHEGEPGMAALWVAGTYCPDAFNIFPRLGATAPAEECGKTTLLEVIQNLAHRSVATSNLSTAVAFRIIELYRPTLLIDEMDTFISQLPELVGILNSGHKKGAYVYRCEKINDKQEICRFATYGPVAYGMIGRPTGTLFSRTVFVRLDRKGPDETTEDLDLDENAMLLDEFVRLRRKLLRWTRDNLQAIKDAKPSLTGLANRARDNWRPLLKIASVAGSEWLEKAHAAAGAPTPRRKESDQVRLLRDIRNIFHTRNVGKLPTSVLVADLAMQEESPWRHYQNGRDPIDARGLAELLEAFDIRSKTISLTKDEQLKLFKSDGKQRLAKGYELAQFATRFAKYLPGENLEEVLVERAASF
jgi:putative DNA primase/helicase